MVDHSTIGEYRCDTSKYAMVHVNKDKWAVLLGKCAWRIMRSSAQLLVFSRRNYLSNIDHSNRWTWKISPQTKGTIILHRFLDHYQQYLFFFGIEDFCYHKVRTYHDQWHFLATAETSMDITMCNTTSLVVHRVYLNHQPPGETNQKSGYHISDIRHVSYFSAWQMVSPFCWYHKSYGINFTTSLMQTKIIWHI